MHPRIGITTHARAGDRPSFSIPCAYVDALDQAGATAVLLPPLGREDAVLDAIDALVLPGGGDIDPRRYGAPLHAQHYDVNEERDGFELGLVRAALARELPVLCICRGMQVLNVALGGDVIAHLPDVVGEDVSHCRPGPAPVPHDVTLAPGTRVHDVHGVNRMRVQSMHHQAVGRLAAGLDAVAWSSDGLVEAVESSRPGFLLGVQWHPELDDSGTTPRRIFDTVVRAARDYGDRVRPRASVGPAGVAPRRATT